MTRGPRATWLADHAIVLTLAVAAVTSVVVWYRTTYLAWFFSDEWKIINQVQSVKGIFQPYNSHLSISILAIYRALIELFGFTTYTPFRLVGFSAFIAVAFALFGVVRRQVGLLPAAFVCAWFLAPFNLSLEPGGMNHPLAVLGAVSCAHGLNGRGRRRDLSWWAGSRLLSSRPEPVWR